ncbi:hypothetical protein [Luteococcus sp. OSA5]|uniref:hypothetical protein n=1 Tax=Luteococcus sp. OSA5 TaxID=3401630 RepID=UPI003B42D191
MALFSRRTDPPMLTHYRQHTGRQEQMLAWAQGPRVELLAFLTHFAVRYAEGEWQLIGWHHVRSGGWRAEGEELHWRLADGSKENFHLTEVGDFPGVFRDRVQASIVVEDRFEPPTGGLVLLTARRDLAEEHPRLDWHVEAIRGASLQDPQTKRLAELALARLRADYDF